MYLTCLRITYLPVHFRIIVFGSWYFLPSISVKKQANGGLSKDFLLPVIIFVIPVLISFLLWFLLWLGKKREMFFQQKESNIIIDVGVIYCHSGFISFSGHDYWISHHCRIHLSMENVFINTFYFYIYCKHGKRRKYGALQTLATMAELLLSC